MTSPTNLANRREAMKLRALCVKARDAHIDAIAQIDRDWPPEEGTPMTDDKPSAPERINVWFSHWGQAHVTKSAEVGNVEYVRSDLTLTPVSRAAVEDAVFNLAAVAYDAGHVKRGLDDTEVYPFIDRIMALIEGRKP